MKARVGIRWPSRRTRIVLYGVVPFVMVGAMVAMYYSDVDCLRRIVSPDLESVRADTRREFGLLESLQNLLLLALAIVAIAGLRRKRLLAERLAIWLMLIGAVFMLMEETDYGFHYLELFGADSGVGSVMPGHVNIHRIGYTQVVMRNIAKFGMLAFFGGFAIVFARSPNPRLRYIAPDRFSVLTILLVTALQELVWKIIDRIPLPHGSLDGQEGEFSEVGIYYLALLYAIDMIFWRTYEPAKPDEDAEIVEPPELAA